MKTHKSPEIARLQLGPGAVGLTVATLGEAEVFAQHGCTDLFIAYPVQVDERAAERLRDLAERGRVAIGVDSVEGAARAGRLLAPYDVEVVVEVDSGQHRTGCLPEEAGSVAVAAARAGLTVRGVFTFPGTATRRRRWRPRRRTRPARWPPHGPPSSAEGLEVSVVSGGSTPSLAHMDTGCTEARPGVYVFGDAQQWELGSMPPESIALTCRATVVSHAGGRAVLDAGSKALAADRAPYAAAPGGCSTTPRPGSSSSPSTTPWWTSPAHRSPGSAASSTWSPTTAAPRSTSPTTSGWRSTTSCGPGRSRPGGGTAERLPPTLARMSKRLLPALLLLATAALAGCGDDDDGDDSATDTPATRPRREPGGSAARPRGQLRLPGRPVRRREGNEPPPSTPTVGGRGHGDGEDHDRRHDVHPRRRQDALHRELVRLAGATELLQRHPLPPAHDLRGDHVLQCGDPTASGTGARATPSADEVDGPRPTARGVLAMAKTSAPTPAARSSSSCTTTPRSRRTTRCSAPSTRRVAAIAQVAARAPTTATARA